MKAVHPVMAGEGSLAGSSRLLLASMHRLGVQRYDVLLSPLECCRSGHSLNVMTSSADILSYQLDTYLHRHTPTCCMSAS